MALGQLVHQPINGLQASDGPPLVICKCAFLSPAALQIVQRTAYIKVHVEAGGGHGCIDVEGHRTFTEMIRETVAVHAGQGEAMVQPAWREERGHHLFRTQFAMVSPRSVSNPKKLRDTDNLRSGVALDRNGRALGCWVEEATYPSGKSEWRFIPRELANGRLSFIHIFEKKDARQTRGANLFMTTLERMKMLDSLQHTWLQNAVVGAMYAATIESEPIIHLAVGGAGDFGELGRPAGEPLVVLSVRRVDHRRGTSRHCSDGFCRHKKGGGRFASRARGWTRPEGSPHCPYRNWRTEQRLIAEKCPSPDVANPIGFRAWRR